MVMVAGEIATQAKLEYDKGFCGIVAQIGFDSFVDDLSSVDSKGLSYKTCKKFRCISPSRALTLLVACMLPRTTWMLEPVTRPPIICL